MLRRFFSKSTMDAASVVDAAVNNAARLEAENASLRAENTRLKVDARRGNTIINTTLNLIWQRDLNLSIVYCNLAFTEVAEESAESVIAVGDMELYRGHRTLAQKALETGQEQFERRHIIVAGERRLYMMREVPMKGEGTIGFAINITELEVAQEEIQRHISALRDLLESSTSAMAIYGRDSKLKFYNFAFVNLWKMDEVWLDSEPTYGEVLEVMREKRKLPEQSNFKAFKQAQMKLFTTLIEPSEEFFYLPDGKTLRVIAIPHALGGILFAYEDVTDRLALERSYNTLIAVQRETLDHLHEGVAVFAETGRLTLCNPTFNKLWHMDVEFTATEPHIRDVFAKARDLFVTDDWTNYLAGLVARFQQRRYLSLRFERADGTVIDCSAVPLPDGATLLSFNDVTDSTLVERSLRDRAEALETADRMKTEFLANMSYELRSPLTSISGFSEMLTHEYAGALNASQKDYVSGIYQSSQHLGTLIGDIIDLATIEAGFLKLDIQPFDIRLAIDSVIALLRARLKLQDVTIDVMVSPDVKTLEADEIRVKQILANLLSYAVRVTKSKGHIQLVVDNYQNGGTRISVRDDGPGLDEQRRAKLFDPFFRGAHASGSDSALSLSLVKRFVELHGGQIHVESELGKGTIICCIFSTATGHVAI